MRALLAFDKFKDALTAPEACACAAAALREVRPDWNLDECPLADGGDGFAAVLTRAAGGQLLRATVTGPGGDPVVAEFGLVEAGRIPASVRSRIGAGRGDCVGVVEMAAASGLARLRPADRDVWRTTTLGTGELVRAAATAGATVLLLGIGGSATNDLGLGALVALGLTLEDEAGAACAAEPQSWSRIARLRGRPEPLPPVFVACDVANPLLGPAGAAAVYGPQKGLAAVDVPRLEHEAARLALMLCAAFEQPDSTMDMPGTGAAGGLAFGLMAGLRARLVPGFDVVADWLDLHARLAAADVVITGEGRFDDSSLSGKGPGAIVKDALAGGKSTHVFAGAVALGARPEDLGIHSITPAWMALDDALRQAPRLLASAVRGVFA